MIRAMREFQEFGEERLTERIREIVSRELENHFQRGRAQDLTRIPS